VLVRSNANGLAPAIQAGGPFDAITHPHSTTHFSLAPSPETSLVNRQGVAPACRIKFSYQSWNPILSQIQRVLAQGNFDGLCLIYSLFNAFKALKRPKEQAAKFARDHRDQWIVVIGNTPSLHNFVLGSGSVFGIQSDEMDVKVKRAFIATSFDVMTEESNDSCTVTATDIQSLVTMDFTKSVAVLCVKKRAKFENGGMGEHWITIVGRDDELGKYLVACSNTLLHYGFTERQDEQTGRFYNTTIDVAGITKATVYSDYINQVHVSKR